MRHRGLPTVLGCIEDTVTLVTALRDDPRLFAVERAGRIRILVNEQLTPVPFVDLSADASGPEGPSCHGSVFRLEVTKP